MPMEIAGHEFWSADGKTIWFDLQTPRSKEFWLAGVNVETGKETRYKLEWDWWSIHYNVSRDGKLFARLVLFNLCGHILRIHCRVRNRLCCSGMAWADSDGAA